ncbi:MAG: hypothetical protein WA304_06320 [Candidatus Cybelea sp.]
MPLPKLLGWVKRAEEIGTVLAAILAGYVAWDKVAPGHQRYGAVVIAAVLASFAAWVILGWFGVVRGPTFGIDELKSKIFPADADNR